MIDSDRGPIELGKSEDVRLITYEGPSIRSDRLLIYKEYDPHLERYQLSTYIQMHSTEWRHQRFRTSEKNVDLQQGLSWRPLVWVIKERDRRAPNILESPEVNTKKLSHRASWDHKPTFKSISVLMRAHVVYLKQISQKSQTSGPSSYPWTRRFQRPPP